MKNNLIFVSKFVLAAWMLLTLPACKPGIADEQSSQLFITSFRDSIDQGLVLMSLNPDSLTIKITPVFVIGTP